MTLLDRAVFRVCELLLPHLGLVGLFPVLLLLLLTVAITIGAGVYKVIDMGSHLFYHTLGIFRTPFHTALGPEGGQPNFASRAPSHVRKTSLT